MSRKQLTMEKIIGILPEAEVGLALGMKVGEICRQLGVPQIMEPAHGGLGRARTGVGNSARQV